MSDNTSLINELAEQLDNTLPPYTDGIFEADSDNPLVDTALFIAQLPHTEMPLTIMNRVEARVFEALENPSKSNVRRFPAYTKWLTRIAAAIFIIAIGVNFALLPAINDSVPNDFLYPAKRHVESLRLDVARSDEAKTELLVAFADERLEEANTLLERGEVDRELVQEALNTLKEAENTASAAYSDDNLPSTLRTETRDIYAEIDRLLATIDEANLLSEDEFFELFANVDLSRRELEYLLDIYEYEYLDDDYWYEYDEAYFDENFEYDGDYYEACLDYYEVDFLIDLDIDNDAMWDSLLRSGCIDYYDYELYGYDYYEDY